MSEPAFEPTGEIAQIAAAYSLDAIDLAARNCKVKLDWTVESVSRVEEVLGRMQMAMSDSQPTPEEVRTVAKMFGSYLGEVIRRQYGGEWGMIRLNGQEFPGMKQQNGTLIWPWSKVHKRLTGGSDDNVWIYFQTSTGASPISERYEKPNSPKHWWKFW